jgi:3-dehydroquinate dehydratase I
VSTRPIQVRGRPLAEGRLPAVCAPLVGRTRERLLAETAAVAAKRPDLLEWRVDFFEGIADARAVVDLAAALKQAAAGIPILFTRRSSLEGGEPIAIDEGQVVALCRAVCASGHVDLLDYEMSQDERHVAQVRDAARAAGVGLVLSFHDFHATPPAADLQRRFELAQHLGADVAKIAVMPRAMDDVLTLLAATLAASGALRIPVISMAMGGAGAVTRLAGGLFGSALSFAVGEQASAPGQWLIEELETALALLRKAGGASQRHP